jgi:hypothetical protein
MARLTLCMNGCSVRGKRPVAGNLECCFYLDNNFRRREGISSWAMAKRRACSVWGIATIHVTRHPDTEGNLRNFLKKPGEIYASSNTSRKAWKGGLAATEAQWPPPDAGHAMGSRERDGARLSAVVGCSTAGHRVNRGASVSRWCTARWGRSCRSCYCRP